MKKAYLVSLAVAGLICSYPALANVTSFTSSISLVKAQSTISWDTLYDYEQQDAQPTGITSSIGFFMAMDGATSYSEATADLAAGQLKAMSSVNNANWAPYNNAFARADFGDSFRTYNQNGPFSWANTDAVSFTIDFSGAVGGIGGTNGSRFGMVILQPGALDAYYSWLTTNDQTAYNTWSNAAIKYFDYWIGPDNPGESWITQTFTTFPAQATASFAPGGDFDWAMYLIADASTSSPYSFYTSDFSHTANISYVGPTGATTASASGLFPGTVALTPSAVVPIPATAWLLGSGLLGLAGVARRQARKVNGLTASREKIMKYLSRLFALVLMGSASFLANAANASSLAIVDMANNQNVTIANVCFDYSFTGVLAQCQGAYSFAGSGNPAGADLNYQVAASADYGVLKAYASSSITQPASSGSPATLEPFLSDATANANFRDQWLISGMPNGITGTLQLRFDISGEYDSSQIDSYGYGGISLWNFTTNTHAGDLNYPAYPAFNEIGSIAWTGVLETQFTFGTALDFSVTLSASSVLANLESGGYNGQSSFMDMSHTALMSGVTVMDSNGNPIPFSLSTASGATLFNNLAPAAVPVPTAAWFFGSGLLGLAGVARRQAVR